MYEAIVKPEELMPDKAKPYAVDCWYSSLVYRARAQASVLLNKCCREANINWDDKTPFVMERIKIYKLDLSDRQYKLIFDSESELAYAYRNGKVTYLELKNNIQW